MMPMFLTVHLGNSDQHVTEVPIMPEMLCRDVVELCRRPGEADCYLAESWRGSERVVKENEQMLAVLQRWGYQRGEVRYVLRHHKAGYETDGCRATDPVMKSNKAETAIERYTESVFPVTPLDLSMNELQDLAARQQQQIEAQQQLLAFKEEQLCHLKLQDQRQELHPGASKQERLLQLQDNIRNQEAKLLRVRALRGQVEQKRSTNSKLVEEIEQMTSLFQQKHEELQSAAARVEELSSQLDALRNTRLEPPIPFHPHNSSYAAELKGLHKDLQLRNKLNQEQSAKLQQQRDNLKKKNLEVVAMDQRLAELQQRLRTKKAGLQQKENLPVASNSIDAQHEPSSRVAAVGPYSQSASSSSCHHSAAPLCQEKMVKSSYPDGTATLPMPASSRKPPAVRAKPAIGVETLNDYSQIPSYGASRLGHITEKQLKDNQQFGKGVSRSAVPPAVPSKPKPLTSTAPPTFSKPAFCTGTFPGKQKQGVSQLKGLGVSLPNHSNTLPLHGNKESPPAAAVRPYTPDLTDGPPPVLQKPQTLAASSIYSMYTQQASPGKAYQPNNQGTLPRSKPRVYGKPVLPTGKKQQTVISENTSFTSGLRDFDGSDIDYSFPAVSDDKSVDAETPESSTPRPLSPSKLLPFASNPHRNSDADLDGLRRRLHHAPRPLKKRSSIVEAEDPGGPNLQKLLYQKTTLAAMETISMENISTPGERIRLPVPDDGIVRKDEDKDAGEEFSSTTTQQESFPEEILTFPPPPPHFFSFEEKEQEDDVLNFQQPVLQETVPPSIRSILRNPGTERTDRGVHVQFSPLALLLDSSLEGEFDLVQRVIYDVDDASMPNDEGITALHNAVCAGHIDIVRFLVQFGVNVNAADSDGWTPLHCAASCNNVQVCKFLVESGAAVFAATYSDMQTAADKCEEMEEGYAQCSQFLYGVQEKMGVMNRGVVYALWSYEPQNDDELGFSEGDFMTVLKQEGEVETEWWWARCGDHEGYIPRNLLGLYPRIKPRQRSLA